VRSLSIRETFWVAMRLAPGRLPMKLSDAGLRRHPTKLLYPNHRFPPWLAEDTDRDRSNRLLALLSPASGVKIEHPVQ
jgi:hypothetical protein